MNALVLLHYTFLSCAYFKNGLTYVEIGTEVKS